MLHGAIRTLASGDEALRYFPSLGSEQLLPLPTAPQDLELAPDYLPTPAPQHGVVQQYPLHLFLGAGLSRMCYLRRGPELPTRNLEMQGRADPLLRSQFHFVIADFKTNVVYLCAFGLSPSPGKELARFPKRPRSHRRLQKPA